MTTAYPGGLDNFAEASPTYMSDPDSSGRVHAKRHDDVESAVEAIEAALGVLPPRFRFDESAGRRLFATDKNNGGREQMVYGDTGWRDISGDLINGWTGSAMIRRVGSVVEVVWGTMTGGSSPYFVPMADGFRPLRPQFIGVVQRISDSAMVPIYTNVVYLAMDGWSVGQIGSGSVTFTTTNVWPATLPGVASGAIPTADTLLPDDYYPDVDPDIPTGLSA